MLQLGFSPVWVLLVMKCVRMMSYSILINRDPVGPFLYIRGLWHEDLLSPYLFLLCTEGLTYLLNSAISSGALQGVQICRGAPRVSHLLFMDDCLLFFPAIEIEVDATK